MRNIKQQLQKKMAASNRMGAGVDADLAADLDVLQLALDDLFVQHNMLHIYGHGRLCRLENHPIFIEGAGLFCAGGWRAVIAWI
jgi:hypothetical protein